MMMTALIIIILIVKIKFYEYNVDDNGDSVPNEGRTEYLLRRISHHHTCHILTSIGLCCNASTLCESAK